MTDDVEATRRGRPSPAVVGKQFIKRYYDLLTTDPSLMYRFYQDQSAMVCGEGTHSEDPVMGMEQIKAKIAERGCLNAIFNLEHGSIDAQPSKDGGVLLMVTGTITKKNAPPRQFVQSFFLAEQQNSIKTYPPAYFVLNDTFRIVTPPPNVINSYMSVKQSTNYSATAAKSVAPAASATELPTTAQVKTSVSPASSSAVDSGVPKSVASVSSAPAVNNAVSVLKPAVVPAASGTSKSPSAVSTVLEAQEPDVSEAAEASVSPTGGAGGEGSNIKVNSWAGIVKSTTRKQQTPSPAPQSRAPAPAPQTTPPESANLPLPLPTQDDELESTEELPIPTADAEPTQNELLLSKAAKKHVQLTADEVPSTAVFVKNIEVDMGEEDLKAVFESYLQDNGHILVAPHFDRGFAFVDLGSTAAVARAVSASRGDGIRVGEKRLTVEPSKKPVRPSGLRAMNERKVSGVPAAKTPGQGRGRVASGRGRGGRGEGRGGPRSAQ